MKTIDYSKCKKPEKSINNLCLKQSINDLTICTIDGKKCDAYEKD